MEKALVDQFVQKIYSIFNQLHAQRELCPNATISTLFSSLVDLVLTSDSSISNEVIGKLQQDGTLQSLIDLCCAGEIELERYWANQIISGEKDIREFPYYGNYAQLTDFELQQLREYIDLDGKKLLFIGNGALPLTAIMFKEKKPSLEIRCIDRDKEFVEYAKRLLLRLGISDIYVSHHDISDLDALVQSEISISEIVFIAALVGSSSQQKNTILSNMHPYTIPASLIAVRSVPEDMRRLVYPKFELEDRLKVKYKTLGEYALPRETHVINSLVILSTLKE